MLWMPNSFYQNMVSEADKWAPYETGGVLMGYRANNEDIVVTHMIGAGPSAIRSRYSFAPDQGFQLDKIANIYSGFNGRVTYLGDWHTHPNGLPELSLKDKRTLTCIAVTPASKNPQPIMAILGGGLDRWESKFVRFRSGRLLLWPFVKCKYDELEFCTFD